MKVPTLRQVNKVYIFKTITVLLLEYKIMESQQSA